MVRIRQIEEHLAARYPEGKMRTPTHFSMGQEAVAVGVSAALTRTDVVYSNHRCHAHYLAKQGDLLRFVAELHGRVAGCAGGRGGSVHLTDPACGFVASSAILGQMLPVAAGAAWAFRMEGVPRVAVSYFGDGTIEEGVFHETANFAALHRLPLLLICENNLYSTHSPLEVRQPRGTSIWRRVEDLMSSRLVDGNDVCAVYDAARAAVEQARHGGGPSFIECSTYRFREHVGPAWDFDRGYRTRAEVEAWLDKCPIKRTSAQFVKEGLFTPQELAEWTQACADEIVRVVAMAEASPFPAVDTICEGTYGA
jgi:pyruvate dehydrogenase E1 component alpha subunit